MFTVEWFPEALDELTRKWLAAAGSVRKAITAAVHRIDQALQGDPIQVGESREGIDRLMFEEPLLIVFEVHESIRTVRVREVRWARRLKG